MSTQVRFVSRKLRHYASIRMLFQRILVPVDYSEHSRRALSFAVDLAERFGASLDVVHVWDKPTYVSDAIMVSHENEHRPLTELIRENAERDMQGFLSSVSISEKVPHSTRLLSGDPASALLKDLEKGAHDLVIVGTHGRSGFAHWMLGSVAEKLVRHSSVPVLTVPPAS